MACRLLPSLPLPNTFLFIYFTFISFMNFCDRGIIPGASNEFNAFIQSKLSTSSPDVYLGLLQSSFVAGYSVACLVCAHLLHRYRYTTLLSVSLSLWVLALLGSGFAGEVRLPGSDTAGSYWLLLSCRCLSGVAEAAFQVSVPPLIQDRCDEEEEKKAGIAAAREGLSGGSDAGDSAVVSASRPPKPFKNRGATWLAVYFSSIPVGTACGYVFGSALAGTSLGWQSAFYFEALLMVPVVGFLAVLRRSDLRREELLRISCVFAAAASDDGDGANKPLLQPTSPAKRVGRRLSQLPLNAPSAEAPSSPPTVLSELKSCLKSPIFICVCLSYAAYTASLIAISTFGSASVVALGFFSDEATASIVFGLAISVGGVIGTPLGGVVLDGIKTEPGASNAEKLAAILKRMNFFIIGGTLLLWPICFVRSSWMFFLFFQLGCIFLFMSTSGFSICTMLSVKKEHRSFGLALSILCVHVLGDVPSPIVVGWVKDTLSPKCVVDANGDIEDMSGCMGQGGGIREMLGLCLAWLTWSAILFEIGRRLAIREVEREKKLEHIYDSDADANAPAKVTKI